MLEKTFPNELSRGIIHLSVILTPRKSSTRLQLEGASRYFVLNYAFNSSLHEYGILILSLCTQKFERGIQTTLDEEPNNIILESVLRNCIYSLQNRNFFFRKVS